MSHWNINKISEFICYNLIYSCITSNNCKFTATCKTIVKILILALYILMLFFTFYITYISNIRYFLVFVQRWNRTLHHFKLLYRKTLTFSYVCVCVCALCEDEIRRKKKFMRWFIMMFHGNLFPYFIPIWKQSGALFLFQVKKREREREIGKKSTECSHIRMIRTVLKGFKFFARLWFNLGYSLWNRKYLKSLPFFSFSSLIFRNRSLKTGFHIWCEQFLFFFS